MYRSIFHWRPLLNGYASYWPRGFAERMELALRLPDPEKLAALRRETGLTTILVRTDQLAGGQRAWQRAADGGHPNLELVARDGTELLFEVHDAIPDTAIDP